MAIVLTVGGAAQLPVVGSLRIAKVANGRGTASFKLKSLTGTYRPALDAEVIITENATRIFGGLLDRPRERGIVDGSSVGIMTTMDAVDFNAYTERVHVNETIPAGTLEDALTILVANYLTDYGVTLDAGQVTGPSLPELAYAYVKVSEVLNQLATLTGEVGEPYVWRIDDFKVLRMYQPSTTPASFDLVGEVIPEVLGDLEVESTRGTAYGNRVIVRMPPNTEMNRTETFTGDNTTTVFQLQYTPFATRGYVVTDFALNWMETLSAPGGGGTWELDPNANTLERVTGAPPTGADIRFTFDGTFSGLGIAEDAGEIASFGLWERVFTLEAIPSNTTAQALADAYLAQSLPVTKTIKYRTLELGLTPGQSQTVTIARRDLSGTAVVTDVNISDLVIQKVNVLVRDVTAVVDAAQTNLGRGWRDVYRLWAGDKTGSSAVAAGTTVGPGVPPGPGSGVTDSYVIKTADETVTGSAALQDDDHLACPLEASAVYLIELVFLFDSANTTHDMKIGWTYPTGTTMLWAPQARGAENYWIPLGSANFQTGLLTETTVLDMGTSGVAGTWGAWFMGIVSVSTTAGTLQFQWAQNTSDAGALIVKRNSFLRYRRLI